MKEVAWAFMEYALLYNPLHAQSTGGVPGAALAKVLAARGASPKELIEFGVVQKYNRNKGFGFIDCVFLDPHGVNASNGHGNGHGHGSKGNSHGQGNKGKQQKDRLFVYHHEIESADGGFRYLEEGTRVSFIRRVDQSRADKAQFAAAVRNADHTLIHNSGAHRKTDKIVSQSRVLMEQADRQHSALAASHSAGSAGMPSPNNHAWL
jgi:cold shock CspA family protein